MPTPNDSGLPLRPALRAVESEEPTSPRSNPTKVVSIADPQEVLLPSPLEDGARTKQYSAGTASRRLIGRPVMPSNSSSRLSTLSTASLEESNASSDASQYQKKEGHVHKRREHHEHHVHQHDKLLTQVSEWLQKEKAKRAARKSQNQHSKSSARKQPTPSSDLVTGGKDADVDVLTRPRAGSQNSDSSALSLEALQRILEDSINGLGSDSQPATPSSGIRRPSYPGNRRKSSIRKLGAGSSDTEYQDGDVVVPSCDVVLDNSKTMSYSGGAAGSSHDTATVNSSKRAEKERKAWMSFKNEIVKLAHTLRLKGWRRVPLERGGDIVVERLSGALTNAVYVVCPPDDLPLTAENSTHKHKPPPKLLLRIYGPQVEHLIDRENELGILRRLARKRIGPRLLGTFTNGRFEEFFNAQTLTFEDLRVPDTSKQIAKRMRELHDGIDLLEREREEGPFVWQNWDKWVGRCEQVITYLDKQILSGAKGKSEPWRSRGLVCGVEWKVFKHVIDRYRLWLDDFYREKGGVHKNLVFAHNDTQYGNILRLVPEVSATGSAPSPLLLPQNTHKQLVVIDFEYASANTPGLEFANHFTEWCYNYHDAAKPWECNVASYPSTEEQRRFVKSYLNHRPQFNPRASATPKMAALDGTAKGSISEFLLDSRIPSGSSTSLDNMFADDEVRREKDLDRQCDELLKEIRVWRVANSAQWVAWGIVQAKVPELDATTEDGSSQEIEAEPMQTKPDAGGSNVKVPEQDKRPEGLKAEALLSGDTSKEAEALEDDEDEFDYLAYAQARAMFFWGDVVTLGLVKKEELPDNLVRQLKIVDH